MKGYFRFLQPFLEWLGKEYIILYSISGNRFTPLKNASRISGRRLHLLESSFSLENCFKRYSTFI